MSKPARLSGFPEWLPAERLVENHVIDILRRTFELHGYAPLHTRAVEPLSRLAKNGEIDKEIFTVGRLSAGEAESKNPLGLHFDLTVPLARFVTENAGRLDFPFKRYQIQPVWRGERPQDGRFREFIQADIDVIGDGALPEHYETEVALVIAKAFEALRPLGLPPATILVNNRRLIEGFARGAGLEDVPAVLRSLDKLDKIGPDRVHELLLAEAGADDRQARLCLALAAIESEDDGFVEQVRALGVSHPMLDEGLEQLARLVRAAAERAPGTVRAQLKIARGLDYYTGTVYETVLHGHEDLGSVASGGRYDSLASLGSRTFPGVGFSLGLSRLLSRLIGPEGLRASRKVPAAVLVAVTDEESRPAADRAADALRARGIPAEVSPDAAKFGKQIKYADRRGIPFVWFPGTGLAGEVKDIRSGEQSGADAGSWEPPAEDLWPRVVGGAPSHPVGRQ
ncbi:histidine--tRNA ligase [Sediminivirga luteola]|uniref:Histidine--tRNA ligase n=1 Tax=Sediminivirga luteola TaxID=1774748 RepID=A0A8J2TZ07_9MICO|nr:histidine--tRNA ligase [Sediminivirga luteola]MCI2264175.1 histidine--tRNA ligase [Sediminivirga luteola]GGA17589.1 histidine--tRNA ligase [Sediminivirga luteola]